MSLGAFLRCRVLDVARFLGVQVIFEGEPCIAPGGAHLVCKIGQETARAAALGKNAPTRVDGALELTAVSLAGSPEQVEKLASQVASAFPRGSSLEYADKDASGEIVFCSPVQARAQADSGRQRCTVKIGFYAIIFKN